MQRPFFSQSPNRVGSGPSRPPISRGCSSRCGDAGGDGSPGVDVASETWGPVDLLSPCFIAKLCQTPGADAPFGTCVDFDMTALNNLPQLAAVRVRGADASTFLQGQLSCDVARIAPGAVVDGAWLSPAGRVICLTQVLTVDDGLLLFMPSDLIDGVATRLERFRFRADVTLLPDYDVGVTLTTTGSECLAARTLPPKGRDEYYVAAPVAGDREWLLARLAAGYPWIDQNSSERYTAHQLNLDRLGALSLDKGCYSGQEIVARTTHRGRVKRRARRFRLESTTVIAVGEPVLDDHGNKAGEIISVAQLDANAQTDLLALVASDLNEPIFCAGAPLSPLPLPFDT